MTIEDVDLFLSGNKFSKKFTSYTILFFINFEILGYNQVKLNMKYRNQTAFIIFLDFMQMTTLASDFTNLVVKFINIISKILVPYWWNWIKLFLNNIRVKGPKITYTNKKLILKIR